VESGERLQDRKKQADRCRVSGEETDEKHNQAVIEGEDAREVTHRNGEGYNVGVGKGGLSSSNAHPERERTLQRSIKTEFHIKKKESRLKDGQGR